MKLTSFELIFGLSLNFCKTMENYSVEYALRKGRIKLSYIPVALFISGLGPGMIGLVKLNFHPGLAALGGFLIGAILAWLWWSFTSAAWKIDAFGNTRNVHELRQKAIREKLIYPEGHWGNKTEIWSQEQRDAWSLIEKKFEKPDELKVDGSLPEVTEIYFAKRKNYLETAGSILLSGLGIWLLTQESYIIGGLLVLGGLYGAWKNYKEATNPNAQLTIGENGISVANGNLYSWDKIVNEEAYRDVVGKNAYDVLEFQIIDPEEEPELYEDERIELEEFTHSAEEIDHLLRVYRSRYQSKKQKK